MIRNTVWHGYQAVEFEAGGYEAMLIPGVGANLVKLRHRASGIDILRTPTPEEAETFASRPQIFGLPLLFPPNRIADGRYTCGEMTYQFPITQQKEHNYHHGIIKGLPFTVTRCDDDGECVRIEARYYSNRVNDAIFMHFPHAFVCKMSFTLSDKGLEHTVSFKNLSNKPMPIGVGYHTPIVIPFAGGDGADYRMRLSVGERYELDDRNLPTGTLLPLDDQFGKLRGEGMQVTGCGAIEAGFSASPIEVDGKPYNGAVVASPDGRSVYYRVDDKVHYWTLWNNGGTQQWACPEPQSWATNAPNLALPAEKTGFETVAPGDKWKMTSQLYVK